MCGLTGFLSPAVAPTDGLEVTVRRMADSLAHRGPDDAGVWVDPDAGVALGHRRLAIIDLSPSGHQPMHSICSRYVVVYNGEIYNFRALRAQLEEEGERFRSRSDTEVLLAAVRRWGVEQALRRFNGMFAFALWDCHARRLVLARDRLGEKPLYYGWMGRTFLFGSELKALRAHPDFVGEVDRGALALYMRHNYVPAPYCIYRGVRKLPPGTWLSVAPGRVGEWPTPAPYWSLRAAAERGVAEPLTASVDEATAELDALLRDAVRLRMEADVPLGAFLSGGIDSSTVVALMQAQSTRPARTFTIGFHVEPYNEAEHAKAVARHLGTDHTELYVTPAEALAVIPRLPALYDEPFADSSQVPTFLVAQMARRHVTVALSGDGGDELFGGYNRYFWGRDLWHRLGRVPPGLRRMAARGLTAVSTEAWGRVLRGLDPLVPKRFRTSNPGEKVHKLAGVMAVENPTHLYLELVSHWDQPAAVVVGAVEPATPLTDPQQWPAFEDLTLRMMYLDAVTYLPDDILAKVDRASMGVSLEARIPLLDHRIVEYAWRLPLSYKVQDGQGKMLLRRVLYRYVPRDLVERPKMGFGVPIDAWLRGPLREWAEDLLAEHRLRAEGYFDPEPIRLKWREHQSGTRDWHYPLWDVLMFQAWLEGQRGRAA